MRHKVLPKTFPCASKVRKLLNGPYLILNATVWGFGGNSRCISNFKDGRQKGRQPRMSSPKVALRRAVRLVGASPRLLSPLLSPQFVFFLVSAAWPGVVGKSAVKYNVVAGGDVAAPV